MSWRAKQNTASWMVMSIWSNHQAWNFISSSSARLLLLLPSNVICNFGFKLDYLWQRKNPQTLPFSWFFHFILATLSSFRQSFIYSCELLHTLIVFSAMSPSPMYNSIWLDETFSLSISTQAFFHHHHHRCRYPYVELNNNLISNRWIGDVD